MERSALQRVQCYIDEKWGINMDINCPWCDKLMTARGTTTMGSGVNQATHWCECGAVVHMAKNFNKEKITGFSIKYEFDKYSNPINNMVI